MTRNSPNRIRARLPRGSDLLVERTLQQLLRWARPEQQPDLAVVLVDADGDRQRANRLRLIVNALAVPTVVTASVQEFEAWLIADHASVRGVLNASALDGATDDPEALPPGAAKTLLNQWMIAAGQSEAEAQRAVRRQVAKECVLDIVRTRCRSFASFASDLSAAIARQV